ncbi:hypothetical protein [Geobacter sp. SVR]|uniref:hypothetical protein n=1 Tax=Geobacter sp. SVR TaxID=2495594 RepID=UPI00143EFABB|nr:hypothetical protein [Geobacter sp. SVR]BCS53180.1 hypothetical protein GSVR_14880 [Geobacter sp. SVR]GCF84565.1 hypothetical protein GSbR_11650 [Geobacter sp. SVR]
MAAQAAESVKTVKIPDDIEYRAIGDAFGLLIACGGLLPGAMVSQRSLEYWLEDIVPLLLIMVMGFRLMRNLMATMLAVQNAPPPQPARQVVQPEAAAMAQLPEVPGYTTEQVLEEVARRIEAKRAAAAH